MHPKVHIFFGVFSFLFLLAFAPGIGILNILAFSLGSILIDSDHYLYYVFKKRDLNPKKAYLWFMERTRKLKELPLIEQKEYKRIFLIFHGMEAWLIFGLSSLYFPIIAFILSGFLFHMLFDWADIFEKNYGWDAFFGRFSWIYALLKDRKKKDF